MAPKDPRSPSNEQCRNQLNTSLAALESIRTRLQAVTFLAEQSLAQMEALLARDPVKALGLGKALPAETEESRAYFAVKIDHIRAGVQSLVEGFTVSAREPDQREVIRLELLRLFIIFESVRTRRCAEAQAASDQTSIHTHIDELILDVINMRERLK